MAGMADDEFQDGILKLAEACAAIGDLPLVALAQEIKARTTQLKFKNPTAYKAAAPSMDATLALTRALMPVQQNIKRPLKVMLQHMTGLKDKMDERAANAAGVVLSKSTDIVPG